MKNYLSKPKAGDWFAAVRSVLVLSLLISGTSPLGARAETRKIPVVSLEIESVWRLKSPGGRFDASGIERSPDGDLLVVRDRELTVYGVKFVPGSDEAILYPHERFPTEIEGNGFGGPRFDVEGLAFDPEGNLYIADETERRVLRIVPGGRLEAVAIDLTLASSYFSKTNRNASFEGIAVGGGSLFLANERSEGRLFEFDLQTGALKASFGCKLPLPLFPVPQYSGLDWQNGKLYVLMREERVIVEVDPKDRSIVRLLRYHNVEMAEAHRYRVGIPMSGVMEGVLVEDDVFWLLTDNNGQGRVADRRDSRPSLFKCRIASRRTNNGDHENR